MDKSLQRDAGLVPPPVIRSVPGAPPVLVAYRGTMDVEVPEGWTNVEVFRLRPEARWPYLGVALLVRAGLAAVMVGAVIVVQILYVKDHTPAELLVYAIGIAALVAIVEGIGAVRMIGTWDSYRMLIADQGLLRVSAREKPVVVKREEINRIVEAIDAIRVYSGFSHVTLSTRIENLPRARERLGQWRQIEAVPATRAFSAIFGLPLVAAIGGVAALLIGLRTEHVQIVVLCLAGATLCGVCNAWLILRMKTGRRFFKFRVLLLLLAPAVLTLRLLLMLLIRP